MSAFYSDYVGTYRTYGQWGPNPNAWNKYTSTLSVNSSGSITFGSAQATNIRINGNNIKFDLPSGSQSNDLISADITFSKTGGKKSFNGTAYPDGSGNTGFKGNCYTDLTLDAAKAARTAMSSTQQKTMKDKGKEIGNKLLAFRQELINDPSLAAKIKTNPKAYFKGHPFSDLLSALHQIDRKNKLQMVDPDDEFIDGINIGGVISCKACVDTILITIAAAIGIGAFLLCTTAPEVACVVLAISGLAMVIATNGLTEMEIEMAIINFMGELRQDVAKHICRPIGSCP